MINTDKKIVHHITGDERDMEVRLDDDGGFALWGTSLENGEWVFFRWFKFRCEALEHAVSWAYPNIFKRPAEAAQPTPPEQPAQPKRKRTRKIRPTETLINILGNIGYDYDA